jgi:hypothetical protein
MPEYAASVMVFNPKEQQDVGGFGGNMPATIWRNAFAPYLADKPTSAFPPADPALMGGAPAPAPVARGGGGTGGGADGRGNGGGRGGNGGGRGGNGG